MNNWSQTLVRKIIIGLIVGALLGHFFPQLSFIAAFGDLFVGALKAVAPVLVLFLVTSAIAQHKAGKQTNMLSIIVLYIVGTLSASIIAVVASFIFRVELVLQNTDIGGLQPPGDIGDVILTLFSRIVDNPINAVLNANYIGILSTAIILGFALRKAGDTTKNIISDIAEAVSQAVRWIINLAPFGVMGIVFLTIKETGFGGMKNYIQIIGLLVGVMFFVALVVNPIIVFIMTKKNPYPLVFTCLKESGIYAFFTRSSAANIPVNMRLCEKLGLDKDTYSVSIPLGATINMSGAAITIAILTLAAVNTLGIAVDIPTAFLLCVISAIGACGASGVAGGSLLLIPLACSFFGIPNSLAIQVVGVGFIVGVIQDSCETALNSSTDVLFTASAEISRNNRYLESEKIAQKLNS